MQATYAELRASSGDGSSFAWRNSLHRIKAPKVTNLGPHVELSSFTSENYVDVEK
jgi:hypothetical protein